MTQEREVTAFPGALALFCHLIAAPAAVVYLLLRQDVPGVAGAILVGVAWLLTLGGYSVVPPGDSRVLLLFGSYKGTIKHNGFYWTNPWMTKRPVSLRARTLNGQQLKVNDATGNPIEIAAVIVWRVTDTYNACFEVDNYEQYVALQSETAVRHLASTHPYDADDETVSLRRNTDIICHDLKSELQERLAPAGVTVSEARLSHLAYAPEIAGAMLRRQQATAVISARQKIVEGAVGMVEMALHQLEQGGAVTLSDEQRASMVANLLVVLCSEQSAQPIVSASS
jgi:regulator of protease activity HflC (stomatin/prohibitin superfamily)